MFDWSCFFPTAIAFFMAGMTFCMLLDFIFDVVGRWFRRDK